MIGIHPLTSRLGSVMLNGRPLIVVPGKYVDTEAERFGDKISVGDIRYADFNPYESAEGAGHWVSGYGLDRYSDVQDSALAHTFTKETFDADSSNGCIIASGERTLETLPGSIATPVWIGEFPGSILVAVAGRKVWTRSIAGTWSDTGITLAANARFGAIIAFGDVLLIGYGTAAPAQWTNDLTTVNSALDSGGAPVYVFAATADRANCYIAGGNATTLRSQVMASLDGMTFQTASIVQCGNGLYTITGLAPGGGVATLFVAKQNELGMIDPLPVATGALYRSLLPFDTWGLENGTGLGWWLGRGNDAQRGPLILHFRRDNDPFVYQPSNEGSGTAMSIAPWSSPYLLPRNIIGSPTAWLGTARWLYYAIKNTITGETYILRRDAQSGGTHAYWDMGTNDCQALTYTSLYTQPLLVAGYGFNVVTTPMPRAGNNPLSDPNCRYIGSFQVDLPGADMGFPDEPKVEFAIRIAADNLAAGVRFIQVRYSLDESPLYTILGVAEESPVTEITFDNPPSDRRMDVRLLATNADNTETIELHGVTLRRSINPTLYRIWEFDCYIPAGSGWQGDDIQDPLGLRNSLWEARKAGTPVAFVDQYGDTYSTRILNLRFTQATAEINGPPQEILHIVLLESTSDVTAYHEFDIDLSINGAAWPLPIPVGLVGLYDPTVATNYPIFLNGLATEVGYMRLRLLGPLGYFWITSDMGTTWWAWEGDLAAGNTLYVNFRPSKHTILDSDGADRSAGLIAGSSWFAINGSQTLNVTASGFSSGSRLTVLVPSRMV